MLLQAALHGVFLVRFSASQPGCFALSYVDQEWQTQQIRHILITPSEAGEGYVLQCADGTAMVYSSIQDLVEREAAKLRFPCPVVPAEHPELYARMPKVAVYSMTKDGWSAPICAGYLSYRYEQVRDPCFHSCSFRSSYADADDGCAECINE